MRTTTKTGHMGWALTGWLALAEVLLLALALTGHGLTQDGVSAVIRHTAQVSLLFFLTAFSASSVRQLWPTPLTKWLLRHRRYIGVAFAVSHTIHLIAIIILTQIDETFSRPPFVLLGGGLAYVFMAAMTATSFDRSAAWLGPRAWSRLHTIGGWYIWIIFAQSYLGRIVEVSAVYALPSALVLAVAVLRIYARRQQRTR